MPAGDGGTKWEIGLACRLTKTMVDGSRRQRRGAAIFFFLWGREELTGLGELTMDGLVMDRMDHLAQRHCWSELPTWRGCGGAWFGLACVGRIGTRQKEKRCRPRPYHASSKHSGSRAARLDCSMGLLGFLDSRILGDWSCLPLMPTMLMKPGSRCARLSRSRSPSGRWWRWWCR